MLRLSSRRHRNKFAALLEEAPERTQKGCGSPRGGTERAKEGCPALSVEAPGVSGSPRGGTGTATEGCPALSVEAPGVSGKQEGGLEGGGTPETVDECPIDQGINEGTVDPLLLPREPTCWSRTALDTKAPVG